eukprot:XP_002260924.1 [Plasmodium knowlesi strain H]
MWFTTRQDGLDDNCHTNRGPCFQISGFFGTTLRIGFFLEFIALTFLFMAYWSSGGKGLFSYDLKNMKDEYRLDQAFRNSITLWSGVYLIGAIFIMSFQVLLADDTWRQEFLVPRSLFPIHAPPFTLPHSRFTFSIAIILTILVHCVCLFSPPIFFFSWARGYRAGSKILRLASFLDTISATLHGEEACSAHPFEPSVRSECLEFAKCKCALPHFLIPHLCVLSPPSPSPFVEIFVIFCNSGCYSNFLLWLALGAVSLWSYYFEPEVNHVSPALHETELTNDVEQQVEKFSRYTPYPQEQNQNAYYPA